MNEQGGELVDPDNEVLSNPELADLIKQDLSLRAKDIEIRAQEIDRDKHQTDTDAELSKQAIEAQVEIEKESHKTWREDGKRRAVLIGLGLVLATVFSIYALTAGKEDTVLELIKLAGIILGSGVGGYAYGYQKGQKSKDDG